MSIQADIREIESIMAELKRLTIRRKQLNEQKQKVEERIQAYLKSKEAPGVKHNGFAIILDEKEKHDKKPKKEQIQDSLAVLQKYGIQDTQKVFQELMEAKKGEMIIKEKVKIQKIKKT